MGKISKGGKTFVKGDEKAKVKKLAKNPGISKSNSVGKLNLKDARVPLMQILKNKSDAAKSVTLVGVTKSLKSKNAKTVLAPLEKTLKPKLKSETTNKPKKELKVEAISLMKTLKRKSVSENIVKLPLPKKKIVTTSDVTIEKPNRKVAKKVRSEGEQIVEKKEAANVEEEASDGHKKKKQTKKQGSPVDVDQVKKGVSAVLKLAKLQAENKKVLFEGEHQPIFLQVSCIKVPKVPTRLIRMMLPCSLVTDTDDVALFVADMQKGRRQDFEPTINHYQDLLRENGCTQIKDVIPLMQLKTEWGQFELKRKLLSSYDFFLVDGKISGHTAHILGKIFKRKLPTSIRMNGKNLKLEIDNALRKTMMQLHSNGDSHIVQIGHTAMKKSELLANVTSACKSLAALYPGRWPNIRNAILKTSTSLAVPIYLTLKSKNKVKVPVIKAKRPKAHQTVAGELSTTSAKNMVFVQPDGTVILEKYKDQKTKEVGEPEVENINLKTVVSKSVAKDKKISKTVVSKSVAKDKKISKKNKPSAVQLNLKAKDSNDNSKTNIDAKHADDSEGEIEEAEQAYLSRLQRESSPTTTEEKSVKKKSKIVNNNKKKKKTKA